MIDNALSPRLVEALTGPAIDAVHVVDLGLASASDDVVLHTAFEQGRVLLTCDGDFAQMLAHSGAEAPSLVLLRAQTLVRPNDQAPVLANAFEEHAELLREGGVVVVLDDGTRARKFPLG